MHVLFHVPAQLKPATPFEQMKLRGELQNTWLKTRQGVGPAFPFLRIIQGENDNASVATYVSRLCSEASWNDCRDIHFSQ
jgi:hypothetical protein